MTSYEQDTWELNIAWLKQDQNQKYWEHYGRVVLPTTMTKQEAQMRSEAISHAIQTAYPDVEYKFKLSRWELRGREVSF